MGGEAAGVDQHDEHLDSWEITSPEGQISWISEIFIWLQSSSIIGFGQLSFSSPMSLAVVATEEKEPELWPKSFFCNGWLLVNNAGRPSGSWWGECLNSVGEMGNGCILHWPAKTQVTAFWFAHAMWFGSWSERGSMPCSTIIRSKIGEPWHFQYGWTCLNIIIFRHRWIWGFRDALVWFSTKDDHISMPFGTAFWVTIALRKVIRMAQEKMSKSKGNFFTVDEIIKLRPGLGLMGCLQLPSHLRCMKHFQSIPTEHFNYHPEMMNDDIWWWMPQNGDFLAPFSNKHAGKTTRNWQWQSAGPSGAVDFDPSHHPKVRKVI